jgi:hypothetical protein
MGMYMSYTSSKKNKIRCILCLEETDYAERNNMFCVSRTYRGLFAGMNHGFHTRTYLVKMKDIDYAAWQGCMTESMMYNWLGKEYIETYLELKGYRWVLKKIYV